MTALQLCAIGEMGRAEIEISRAAINVEAASHPVALRQLAGAIGRLEAARGFLLTAIDRERAQPLGESLRENY